jgi:hypothetical protein
MRLRRPGRCFTVPEMAEPQPPPIDRSLLDELVERIGDAIVERVVKAITAEGLDARLTPKPKVWLDAREAANRLGVTREWVYEHANELGATRIGSGPRPRLRFPAELLDRKAQASRPHGEDAAHAKPRSKPAGLIPIRAA